MVTKQFYHRIFPGSDGKREPEQRTISVFVLPNEVSDPSFVRYQQEPGFLTTVGMTN